MNATAPAINVKESATAYTMEVAAPGLKKDMVKMNIDKDGYLNVSIENKEEKKEEKKEEPKAEAPAKKAPAKKPATKKAEPKDEAPAKKAPAKKPAAKK